MIQRWQFFALAQDKPLDDGTLLRSKSQDQEKSLFTIKSNRYYDLGHQHG